VGTTDLIIIGAYLFLILIIGLMTGLKKTSSSDSFFLAGHSLRWPMVGAALFAANISTIQMVGLAGQGFSDGLVWGNFEWMAAFLLIILGLIFAPFYFKSKISTLPEFFEKRYSPQVRIMLAVITFVLALFVHIGVSLYAGAVVFENFFGINKYTSILVIAGATLIYTVAGGLRAVVITETIQTLILIIGASIMLILAYSQLSDVGIYSWEDIKAACKTEQLSMIHSSGNSPLPWWTVLLGYPVLGLSYWCADQTIVQKVLGAKTLKDAQAGPVFAGFIKITPVFIMVFPGVFAYILFGNDIAHPDYALPELIVRVLPVGLKGLMAAALMAALMSTIAAALNSSGTLVAMDIVKKISPQTKDKTLVIIGRITIVAVIAIAVAWSPLIEKFPTLFIAINDLLAVLSPPIASVLAIGIVWKRGTKEAGLYTMICGFILGILSFIIDFEPISGQRYIAEVLGIHFLMKAWWLFVFCVFLFIIISFLTPKPDMEQTSQVTLKKPLDFITKGKMSGIGDPRLLSAALLVLMIVLYYMFR
jgi:solute:Na+ symporter, SSS family